MTQGDRKAFAVLMLGLGETYGEPVSEARMEIYFAALSDLDLPDIRAALNVLVRTSKFFPRPAEIREAVCGSAEDRAELAWSAVQRIVRAHGWANPPKDEDWPDEATRRAAMELYGGWRALCENLPAAGPEMLGTAKLFKSSFAAYARRDDRVPALPPSRDEARAVLSGLKAELAKRGLPNGELQKR
jgi:hypothetical protein